MIFKRRERRSFWDRVRDLIQPRKGWRRGFAYIGRRVQRLPDTPHRIALGFACGGFASFSPFFTLHALVALILAWMVRGNILAGVFGTIVGNPLSFPFIAAISLQTGNWLLGRTGGTENLDQLSWTYVTTQPLDFLESIFTPYLIGGLVPGLICGLACYFAIRPIVARFQERRRRILSERARALVAERRAARRAKALNDVRADAGDSQDPPSGAGAREASPGQAEGSEDLRHAENKRAAIDQGAKGEGGKPLDRLSAALPPLRRPRPAGGPR